MRQISLKELRKIAEDCKDDLYAEARSVGQNTPKLFLHWTAGSYFAYFDEYHINVNGDGEIMLSTDDLSDVLEHTWKRNTGNIGIALCCAMDAGSKDLGGYPPTEPQIEIMAQIIATLAIALNIPITKQTVLTHGEAAANEDGWHSHLRYSWWYDEYEDGDTRGDLEYLGTKESPVYNPWAQDGSRGGDVLRGKANFYRNYWEQ